MLKAIAVLTIPGALGGAGYYYSPYLYQGEPHADIPSEAYVIEVGVAFPEATILDALPEGLSPTDEFTGGIAIHIGDETPVRSPFSTGYAWVDVTDSWDPAAVPRRFLIKSAYTEELEDASTIPQDVAAPGTTHSWEEDGTLRVVAWPDRSTILELAVRPDLNACGTEILPSSDVLVSPRVIRSFSMMYVQAALEWCEAEAIEARISAPRGDVLNPFVPEQVLWAAMTRPLP